MRNQGKTAEARAALTKALALNKDFHGSEEARRRLTMLDQAHPPKMSVKKTAR